MRSLDEQEIAYSSDDDGTPSHARSTVPTVLLSIAEAASALRIGRSKLYELIADGEVEVVHIGRSCRVPMEAVRAFVDRLRRG